MHFPPADVVASHIEFLRLTGLAGDLTEQLKPLGLTANVDHFRPSLVQYIGVPLPAGGNVLVFAHPKGAWIVGGPRQVGVPMVWPIETPANEIVDVAAHITRQCVTGEPMPSPWRWGRTRPSRLTDLADALLAHGLNEDEVVIPATHTLEGTAIRRNWGPTDVVRVHFDDATFEVTHNPTTGWAVDHEYAGAVGSRRRLDLNRATTGHSEPTPLVPEGLLDANQLADLLRRQRPDAPTHDQWHPLLAYAPQPRAAAPNESLTGTELKAYGERQDARYAAAWLRWCGFTDARTSGKKHSEVDARHITVHIHRAKTPAGQAIVERALGKAAMQGNRAAVISRTSFTRDASKLADAAGVALFTQDGSRVLRPHSTVGKHLMPDPGDIAPPTCDDPTCRTIGCVLEDEYCPTERGRGWVDENP